MLRNNHGQIFTIIEIVVVVAIILILANVMLKGYVGGGKDNNNPVNTPKGRAQSVDCMNNLRQIRMAIDMYHQTGEQQQKPTSLADLASSGISGHVAQCPISLTGYSYDSSTGRVWCTTPGHEKY